MEKPVVGQEVLMRSVLRYNGTFFEYVVVSSVGRKYFEVKQYNDDGTLSSYSYKFNIDDGSFTGNLNGIERTCYTNMEDYHNEIKRFELNNIIKDQFNYKPSHTLEQLEQIAEILEIELDYCEV